MIRRNFSVMLLALAAVTASARAETTLLFNVFFPPGHFVQKVAHDWAADVEKATGGEVKVEFAAGNMAPPPQQLAATASGIFDVSVTANLFIRNKAPLVQVSQLPWLVQDAEAASVALWRMYVEHFQNKNQYPDVQLLSLAHHTGGELYSLSDKPINSIDELKSRKMWALPGEAADLLKQLGMSPITSPAVQVSESVSRGVVEGYYGLTFDVSNDFKASPYTKVVTVFPLSATSTSFSLMINKGKWRALSEKNRAAIQSVSGEKFAIAMGQAANQASANALAKMKASGIKVVDVDPAFYAALQKAAEPAYEQYAAAATKFGLDGRALIAEFKTMYTSLTKK